MKHHNNLTDEQIHNPKGFQPASNRSVMTKNATGGLVWKKANYTSSTAITCGADVAGSLHHKYFCLYSSNDLIKYAVYFNITGGSAMALPSGYDLVLEVDSTATGEDSTAIELAADLNAVINAHADFSSTDDLAGVVTITGTTSATDPTDSGNTGFTITTVQSKIFNEFLSTDSLGDITWASSTPHTPQGTEILSTGEAGATKFLREDGDGTCSWQTPGGGLVTSLTTTGTSGASTLSGGGVLNVPQYAGGVTQIIAGTNVTISPVGGTGAVTVNSSGGGGEVFPHVTKSWRGGVQTSVDSTPLGLNLDLSGRDRDFGHDMALGTLAISSISGVSPINMIKGGVFVVTKDSTTNYNWIGKIIAVASSPAGEIKLYSGRIICEGEIPTTYTLNQLTTVGVPALGTNEVFCFKVNTAFTSPLIEGDIIVPAYIQGGEGTTNMAYTTTLEMQHPK